MAPVPPPPDADDADRGLLGDGDSDEAKPTRTYSSKGEAEDVESAASPVTVWLHLVAFFVGCIVLRTLLLLDVFDADVVAPAVFLILFCGGTNVFLDMYVYKVHRRATTGLDFTKYNPSLPRVLLKCLGLSGCFGVLFFFYWALPEYNGDYYFNYYEMLRIVLPVSAPFAAAYIYYVDARMKEPRDGLYNMGLAMTGRWELVSQAVLSQHLLGWAVKGFFTPLMFVPYCDDIQNLLTTDFRDLIFWGDVYGWLYSFLYFVDLHFATVGYIFTFRLSDTHIRSTESSLVGWVAALLCYSPINTVTSFYFEYSSEVEWGNWLEGAPIAAFIWGSCILVLTALYALAGVYFGVRFSNLTNRGIITAGPYSWTKHPAYLFKNISWWMTAVPWAAPGGWDVALKNCIGLLMFNVRLSAEAAAPSYPPLISRLPSLPPPPPRPRPPHPSSSTCCARAARRRC